MLSQPQSSSQSSSQNPSELADYLKALREQSARENKINKYRRMIFEKNKNPNEYKAIDFFPAIPENLRKHGLDSFNSSLVQSPNRKSENNTSQNALTLIQIKDIQPAQAAAVLNTPVANKSNILAKEHTLQIEVTNTSPVSDPIPSSDESFDKENNENYKKKTLEKSNNTNLITKSIKSSLSARNKLNKIIEKDQQLTPIVNVHKSSNRKTITSAEIEDDLDYLDELDDENLKKSHITKMQTRLSSTAYESPSSANNINKTRSSNKKSSRKIVEEDEENSLSENDEIVASSVGDILIQTRQSKSITNEVETINRSKSIFKNKATNKTKNSDILPEAIDFAPSNLSRRNEKSKNKTPSKQSTTKNKLVRQNKVTSDDEHEYENQGEEQEAQKEREQQITSNKKQENLNKKNNTKSTAFENEKLNQEKTSSKHSKSKITEQNNEDENDENSIIKQKTSKKTDNKEKEHNVNMNSKKQTRLTKELNEEKQKNDPHQDDDYEYSIAGNHLKEDQQLDEIPFENNNESMQQPISTHDKEHEREPDKSAKKSSKKHKNIESNEVEEETQASSEDKNQPKHSSSSKISIIKQTDANNKNKNKRKETIEKEPEIAMPPPSTPVETSEFSAGSTSRRRSARLESTNASNNRYPSSAITDIKVNLVPPNRSQRNLTRQISNLNNNNNEETASTTQDIQDEQELMQSQNNKFIRKSMAKTINSTTGNNQTVNSSTASSLFKSKQALMSAQIPTAPLFNSATTTSSNKNNQKNIDPSQEEQENNNKKKSSATTNAALAKNNNKNNKKQIVESEKSQDEDDRHASVSPVKQKRRALKDIDGNKQASQKHKSQESSPAYMPTIKKKKLNSKPARRLEREETIIEPLSQQPDEDEVNMGLRRSKRAKVDKNSKAVYHYSPIKDFSGNTIYIQKIIGTTDKKDEWMKYVKNFSEQKKINEKKRKHNALLKEHGYENEIQKNNKKTKRIANRNQLNEDDNYENNHEEHFNNDNDNILRKEIILNTQENLNASQTLVMDSDISNINTSQESVLIQDQGATILDNSKVTTEHLYCYAKLNERKQFDECKAGVSIAASSNNSGVLRIDPNNSTKTNAHGMRVVYFVQSGECLVSINNIISKHSTGDVIKVPANISYKIKNIAKDKNDKLYLYFQFLEQS